MICYLTIRLFALDFYEVIVDEAFSKIVAKIYLFLDVLLNLRLQKIARIELSFKIEVVCARASVIFNNFNCFKSQETVNFLCLDFSSKTMEKRKKRHYFQDDLQPLAQPIRLQHLYWNTCSILQIAVSINLQWSIVNL